MYMRYYDAIRNENFWMVEQENVNWLGAYKLHGKNMYVDESLKRIEMICSTKIKDWEYETMRCNRFLT